MFVFMFLLYGELNQMIFLFRCILLLDVVIFPRYSSLCLYPDFSKAPWYGVTKFLQVSSDEDNKESWDSIRIGDCLSVVGEWLDSRFMFFI